MTLFTYDAVDLQFIEGEIRQFRASNERKLMLEGERYYNGEHDVLSRQRTIIGSDGSLEPVTNLPNNRIVDNQYKKMVDQKNNYLLGQPITMRGDNTQYTAMLGQFFNRKFQRTLKNVGEDSLNCGIGWMHICYDDAGNLTCKRCKPFEIVAGWQDAEHTVLDYAIRQYEVTDCQNGTQVTVQKVEVYDEGGIRYFELTESGKLMAVEPYQQNYFTTVNGEQEQGYNWAKIPLIAFKCNPKEIPLIQRAKSLQDGLNLITSNFQNQMEEDSRNTILVLTNYDGENLGEFRKNLATYGAVKVRTVDGAGGDLKTLQVEVNAANYQVILEIFKKAIIENAMGYDAKDDRLSGNPNQMNIQSMYSDIDLDANGMETEFQASFEELLWFVNAHLYNTGMGDFDGEQVDIIFNRDMLMNEGEIIDNCTKSAGMLSDETIIANHPWVDDVQAELDRVATQKAQELEQYGTAFNPATAVLPPDSGADVGGEVIAE